MIPSYIFFQMYLPLLEQNDGTEVDDLSSICMNGSNVYDQCRHDTTQFHPSCTACRCANLPGPA